MCLPSSRMNSSVPTLIAILLFTAVLLFFSFHAYAQSAAATGRLEGTVTDASGAAIAGAEIAVRNQNTGVSSAAQSTAEGAFTMLYLDPGTYSDSLVKSCSG